MHGHLCIERATVVGRGAVALAIDDAPEQNVSRGAAQQAAADTRSPCTGRPRDTASVAALTPAVCSTFRSSSARRCRSTIAATSPSRSKVCSSRLNATAKLAAPTEQHGEPVRVGMFVIPLRFVSIRNSSYPRMTHLVPAPGPPPSGRGSEFSSLDKKSIATPTASGEKSLFMPSG